MILSDFHTLISDEVKKGTTLATVIPGKVRQAVGEIQRRHTFKSMERFTTLTLDSDLSEPRAIEQPTGFKSMYFFRILNSDGTYSYLTEVDPGQVTKTEDAKPQGYWQDGNDYFWLDNSPAEDYNAEMSYGQKDNLNVATTTVFPFLTEFEGLCVSETMVTLGPLLRDDKLVARYIKSRDILFQAAFLEDEEKRAKNRDERMIYGEDTR